MTNSTSAPTTGVHLVFQYFKLEANSLPLDQQEKIGARQEEYQECLYRNLQHPHVASIHIFVTNDTDQDELDRAMAICPNRSICQAKLTVIRLERRMKYSDALQYCNNHLVGKIAVVMNADIFLGKGVDQLLQRKREVFGEVATVLSLTRHEKQICSHFDLGTDSETESPTADNKEARGWCGCPFLRGRRYYGSHDSFWFVPPIRKNVIQGCQHLQNRWGAEHKTINEFFKHGYTVRNPCVTIHTYHNHVTDIHPWRKEPGGNIVLADPRDHKPLPPTEL